MKSAALSPLGEKAFAHAIWNGGRRILRGFSLVEVVIALGICSFALVSILGLFVIGLKSVGESDSRLAAANVASKLAETLRTMPADALPADFPITVDMSSLPISPGTVTATIDTEGKVVSEDSASYKLTARIWRDDRFSQNHPLIRVHLMLSWPPAAKNPVNRYELMTSMPVVPDSGT